MARENSFKKSKELSAARMKAEQDSADKYYKGTNQEQMGNQKFQEIADQRYQRQMADLYGTQVDSEETIKKAKEKRTMLDVKRRMITLRENKFSFNRALEKYSFGRNLLDMKLRMHFYRKKH